MNNAQLRTLALLLLAVSTAVGATALICFGVQSGDKDAAKKDSTRVTEKQGGEVWFKNAGLVKENGIETMPAEDVHWQPKISVDGRVLPNPHATIEVRAPFAGVVGSDAQFRLGAQVKPADELAKFEIRVSELERLDLKTKSVDAEARYKGADAVLKIRQERVERLGTIPIGAIGRGDLDAASIQLAEARMLKDIALSQWDLLKQALDSAGKKKIVVPINAPIAGEIAEIGAQPGANVEAGQLLVRLVDFSRVMVRLDFPLSTPAEPNVEVQSLGGNIQETPQSWHAHLRGPAPNVEIGLQRASYLYEIVPRDKQASPSWRPGLYVKALVPTAGSEAALKIPASALVVHQGRYLVYQKIDTLRYKRIDVTQYLAGREGDWLYLVGGDLTGGVDIVHRGAQAILSEEFRTDVDDD